MGSNGVEETIFLWEEDERKNVTLKNLKTGKRYSFIVRRSFVVGRNAELCDLQITQDDRYMSGRHLRFMNEEGELSVEDLHTKNGTKLNGKTIWDRTLIHRGDILKMGISEFEVTFN